MDSADEMKVNKVSYLRVQYDTEAIPGQVYSSMKPDKHKETTGHV